MEVISTKEEVNDFKVLNKEFYLFPEYRDFPIKMKSYLPKRWTLDKNNINGLNDNVSRGEYYTFQVGVLPQNRDIDDIDIIFTDLNSQSKGTIDKKYFTCFNKGGIDIDGKAFMKKVSVKKGEVQSLWFGLEIPLETKSGTYTSLVIIKPKGMVEDTIHLKMNVSNLKSNDFGDDRPERMSRLRWLNSDIGSDDNLIIKPFKEIKIDQNNLEFLGRKIELNKMGLPLSILSFFSPEMTYIKDEPENILSEKMDFKVKNINGDFEKFENSLFNISKDNRASVNWISENESKNFNLVISGMLEYDGMMDYKIQLIAKNDVNLNDVSLKISFKKEAAKYMLGLGNKGGELNNNINWQWDINKHQEGVWLGNINKGLQYVLRDNNYERPLNTNFYRSKPLNLPTSWYNNSKGGISIKINKV